MAIPPARGGQAKPVVPVKKPATVVGPQNQGLVGGGIGGTSNPGVYRPPAPPAAPVAPAAPAPPPPPPPPDFSALAKWDPEYTTGMNLLGQQNQTSMTALRSAWLGNTQSTQDAFNARGALYSGAAQNAREHQANDYATAAAKQALDYDQGGHNLYYSVINRLMNQWTAGLR